jgi:transketolase
MRDAFLDELYDIAREDKRVMLISNDFGAPSLDKYRKDLPGQFIHIGIAEQDMVDVAAGLALAGKIVYLYSIAPFLPLRCYEQLRVHLGFKGYHVIGVMVGAGYAYDLSGPSHHALEDIAVMNAMPHMTILNASDSVMGAAFARMTYRNRGPHYVRFDREKFPSLYEELGDDFSAGLAVLREGRDLIIVATGVMVHQAFRVAEELSRHGLDTGIIDLYRIKTLNEELLLKAVRKTERIVTIEENFLPGGIGNIIAGLLSDRGEQIRLKRSGPRLSFRKYSGMDEVRWLKSSTFYW